MPNLLLLIPQFLLMDRLHLLDSLTGLILFYVASNLPFTIFLLRGFFEAIPKEYEESFRLDGAGTLRVLCELIVPFRFRRSPSSRCSSSTPRGMSSRSR